MFAIATVRDGNLTIVQNRELPTVDAARKALSEWAAKEVGNSFHLMEGINTAKASVTVKVE